jgi:hypothetical protein
MILTVQANGDPSAADEEAAQLLSDIMVVCPVEITAKKLSPPTQTTTSEERALTKGDPVTIGAITLAAVAGGGALAKALSPGGFFSKLADIVHERAKKGMRIDIVTAGGDKIEIRGSSKEIESLLKSHFRKERGG